MKTLTTIVAVLLLSLGLGASVDPYDIIVVEDETNETVLFRSTIAFSHATTVTLESLLIGTIYSIDVATDGFLNSRIRKEGIPTGAYELVITDERGRTVIPFNLNNRSGLRCNYAEARNILYPTVNLKDERVLVVKYANESGKRVNLRLTNADGQEVFAVKLEGETIRRAYQLDQLEAGEYTVTVSSRHVKNYTAAIALQ